MIQVTLTFASIDAMIGALREIPENALVVGQSTLAFAATTVKEAAAPVEKSKRESKAIAASTQATTAHSQPTVEAGAVVVPEKSTLTPEPQASTAQAADAPSAVEYPVLQKAVFTLAGKSRDAASAVAASFGVKTFKELDAKRWGEALAAVQAKTAELEAA